MSKEPRVLQGLVAEKIGLKIAHGRRPKAIAEEYGVSVHVLNRQFALAVLDARMLERSLKHDRKLECTKAGEIARKQYSVLTLAPLGVHRPLQSHAQVLKTQRSTVIITI